MSYQYKLYGAILGDLAGQPYEYKYKGDFSEFRLHDSKSIISDDTLLTLATASVLLGDFESFEKAYRYFGKKYINLDSFGKGFQQWLTTPEGTMGNSYANGCLMRISPCMYSEYPREFIIQSCLTSHCHPDSVISVLLLESLYEFGVMREYQEVSNKSLNSFKEFDVTAKGTVDFIGDAFMYSNSTSKTIEAVVKCGGDTDTNASIIGELMNFTFEDLTKEDIEYVESKLDSYQLNILKRFNKQF